MYSKAHQSTITHRYQTQHDGSILCSNCSCLGHTSKHCPQPITSYGVIVFTVKGAWNQGDTLLQAEKGNITGLEHQTDQLRFLLIQRRDSIGFVEMMRGKYKTHDTDYILQHLNGMTEAEREALLHAPFDELWEALWGKPMHGGVAYKHEKEQAKQKLEFLRNATPSLQQLIETVAGPAWATPEWGFPKGRRDSRESEYMCAMRELWEETNLKEGQIVPIRGLDPITERFFGSNQVQYSHKYYIAYAPPATADAVDYKTAAEESEHVRREVGNIGWFTLEEALRLIRPGNVEKKEILLRVCNLLRNYCPLRLPA